MSSAKKSPKSRRIRPTPPTLEKAPTGIDGLDSITSGGFPRGRPTLICGGPGCGKTLFGMQFLIHGATMGEPGVVVSFEETADDLTKNVASLGVDLQALIRRKKIAVDYIHVDRSEILETGGYDLSGLFVRIDHAIQSVGAKRILLDTLEVLFAGFSNTAVMRSELERLFRWLKDKGITAVVTGERGEGSFTRGGLEEDVTDSVNSLDHRVTDQVTTRRIRIVKYRGSTHGTNEYPFLIGEYGISVLPITGLGLDYPVSTARVLTGIASLDEMLGGRGYFRGSSVLISGTAGTGKSSVVSSFVVAACERGERCLYFALEEPAAQVLRNMGSIGLGLEKHVDSGKLTIAAARPTVFGLEQHLVSMHAAIEANRPRVVVVDPISSLVAGGNAHEVRAMLVRLFDYLKLKGITGLFTYLSAPKGLEETDLGVSSLIDTWIELRDIEHVGERNRALYILKSRGMPHSNQVREFLITSNGLNLIDALVGPRGVAIGSARLSQDAEARAAQVLQEQAIARKDRALARRRTVVEAQIEALRAELASEEDEIQRQVAKSIARQTQDLGREHRANSRCKRSSGGKLLFARLRPRRSTRETLGVESFAAPNRLSEGCPAKKARPRVASPKKWRPGVASAKRPSRVAAPRSLRRSPQLRSLRGSPRSRRRLQHRVRLGQDGAAHGHVREDGGLQCMEWWELRLCTWPGRPPLEHRSVRQLEEANLRGAPSRSLSPRSGRSARQPRARPRRPDPRRSHAKCGNCHRR